MKIANGGQLLGTTAAIPLTCALTTSCDGVLRLIDQAPRLRSAKIKRPTVYGSARFSIKPGRTKTTRITLNAAGRKKLGKRKRLTLVAMAVVGSKVFSSRVTLNVKRKRN